MDTPQGTFYRVYFDIYLTLDGSEFQAELVYVVPLLTMYERPELTTTADVKVKTCKCFCQSL